MTDGSTTRTAGLIATLFTSLVSFQSACNSGSPETASAPSAPACNLGEQQTKLTDVVTTVAFNPLVLAELGVTVQSEAATGAAPQHTLSILPGPASSFDGASECMAVDVVDGHLKDFVSGRISHSGGPTLVHGPSAVSLVGFELRVGTEPRTFDVVSSTGETLLLGTLPHYQIDATGALDVFNVDLAATPALATRLGAPNLVGTVVGTLTLRAKVASPTLGVASAALTDGKDPIVLNACDNFKGKVDVALTAMSSVQQQARVGNQIVITPSAVLKNVGTANVPWQAQFSGTFPPYGTDQHPFLVWALFRESGGFFEPVGYSDVKHAFLTINSNCAPGSCTIGSVLGLGCEDVYGVGTNGGHLAPRSEILPHAGTWAHCNVPAPNTASHFDRVAPFCSADNNGRSETALTHRATATDAELSVAGASYYFTSWYVVREDVNIFNSMGWRKIVPLRNGNTWSFSFATPFRQGSILDAFVDPALPNPTRSNATFEDPAAGAAQVAATVTALGNGKFRYVYALMNHDFDPKLSALSIPVGEGVTLEDLKFSDGDTDTVNDWTAVTSAGQVTWTAPAPSARLDWGAALTISFVANAAPISNTVQIRRADTSAVFGINAIVVGPLP
ncbi:MAG: hypothetical protein H7138_22575 [Myxococcales bacterium]|nr:hypothetical protein [Myxococcales bacterium]